MMKKVYAVLAAAMVLLAVPAMNVLAEEGTADFFELTITEEAATILIEEETEQAALCRVTFYDFDGNEIEIRDIEAGQTVAATEIIPQTSGATFSHWYDEADEWKAAFDFTQPVYGDVVLVPYGTQMATIEESTPVTDGSSLLDTLVTEPVVLDESPSIYATPAIQPDPTNIISINDIITETATETESPSIYATPVVQPEANSILTIDQVVGAQNVPAAAPAAIIEDTQRAAVEQAAVSDILAAAQNTQTETESLETLSDYDTPLAMPVAATPVAPSVEVICDYDGELKSGTEVTVRAVIHNLPMGANVNYQWQNDASGNFSDVPGANGETFTFVVDEYNAAGCNWRVNVELSA